MKDIFETDVYHIFLKKAEESLNAAQSCFEQEYYNSCVNRAYYAMFQAAVAVLFKAGFRPKSEKIGHDWYKLNFQEHLFREASGFLT